MPPLEQWILPATAVFAILAWSLVWRAVRRSREAPVAKAKVPALTRKRIQMPCPHCGKELSLASQELIRLSPAETGLAVSARPELMKHALSEYKCPHCQGELLFITDKRIPAYVGPHLTLERSSKALCQECRKRLKAPSWTADARSQGVRDRPDLDEDYGLVCSHCESITCVGCCRRTTRGRAPTSMFMCPRCFSYPIEELVHL